jgi:hypothetical protein
MRLPTIIKRDPSAGLATARGKLADVEAKLVALAGERVSALEGSDELSDVVRIDERISEANRSAVILKDRIAALEQAVRQQRAGTY